MSPGSGLRIAILLLFFCIWGAIALPWAAAKAGCLVIGFVLAEGYWNTGLYK